MKNNTYKIDYTTNTMTITKAFERAANMVGSVEYEMMRKIMADFPNIKIVRKTSAVKQYCSPYKGLTYNAMERYIRENGSAKLLNEFEEIRYTAKAMSRNPYLYVRNWFVERFPEWMADNWNASAASEIEKYEIAA